MIKEPKTLKVTALNKFLNKNLTEIESNIISDISGFLNGVFYLTDTSGYILLTKRLYTWEVKRTFYDKNKTKKKTEEWVKNGKLHRENGPAYLEWYDNGQIAGEGWYKNGKCHRENGPSYKQWHKNGQIWIEKWCKNGRSRKEIRFK